MFNIEIPSWVIALGWAIVLADVVGFALLVCAMFGRIPHLRGVRLVAAWILLELPAVLGVVLLDMPSFSSLFFSFAVPTFAAGLLTAYSRSQRQQG